MRIQILLATIACFLIITVLPGCHTSHKYAAAHKSSKQPKFIDDVYISGHNKKSSTENAIDPTKPKPKVIKAQEKPEKTEELAEEEIVDPAHEETCAIEPPKKEHYSDKENNQVRKKYAEILGLKQKEITNYSLYQFIDRWYGTNYRMGGCSRAGIDCSGFAQKLYGEVYGVDLLRTAMEQFSNCKRIKHSKDAEEGDLVFFHVRSRHHITHVGVYLANDYFVHASTSGGVMISNLNEEYWHKYFAGVGRIPKEDTHKELSARVHN